MPLETYPPIEHLPDGRRHTQNPGSYLFLLRNKIRANKEVFIFYAVQVLIGYKD